jgi:photosystem II stability/assembly factor-like uncharacterized protein
MRLNGEAVTNAPAWRCITCSIATASERPYHYIRPALLALSAAILLAACGGGSGNPREAKAIIGAAGGTVQGPDGVQVVVPAGAVEEDVEIRIARSAKGAPALPAELKGRAVVYEITPHGLGFDRPVTIRLPLSAPPDDDTTVLVAEPGGGWDSAATTAHDRYLAVERNTLSWFTSTYLGVNFGACAPARGDPYACVYPTLRPEGEIDVRPAEAWPAPRGLWPEVVRPSSISWPMTVTAARDCVNGEVTVYRRFVPLGTPFTVSIPYQDVARLPVSLTAVPTNSKRGSGTAIYTANVSAGDRHKVALRFVFSCRRLYNGKEYRALLDAGYVAAVPSTPGAPTLSQSPRSVTASAGASATFSVTASAPNTLVVAWQRSNDSGATWITVASGVNLTSYTLDPAQVSDSGVYYRAQVCNQLGMELNCVTSSVATLTVIAATTAPVFTQQPQSISVIEGERASFTAVATGTPAPQVAWFRVGNPDVAVGTVCAAPATGNSTSCTYTTPPLALSDSGLQFRAHAENGAGDVFSTTATVTVTAVPVAPRFTTQPSDVTVTVGQNATFSVTAIGTAPLSYQWQRDGADIAGANAASYTLTNAQLADSGARFRVVVENAAGVASSVEALLTVVPSPVPPAQPGSCTSSNPAGWCWVQPSPHSNTLSALAIDGTTVQAIGRRTAMRSANGGTNWQTTFNVLDITWYDVAAPGSGVLVGAGRDQILGIEQGIYRSTDAAQTWTQVLAEEVYSLAFASATEGVAVGRGIWRTADGGRTWSVIEAPSVTATLTRVVSPAPGIYVAIGYERNPLIRRSVDGGLTWSFPSPTTSAQLLDVDFGSATTGVIIVADGSLLRTTDGGATWSAPIPVATPNVLDVVAFAGANTVTAMDSSGRTYRSTDAGRNWVTGEDLGAAGAEGIARMRFRTATEGYAVGRYGQIWRTRDAGASWTLLSGGDDFVSFASVKFGSGVGLAADRSSVYRTVDGGTSWTVLASPRVFPSDVAVLDASTYLAAGATGISRSTDAGQTWSVTYTLPRGQNLHAIDFSPPPVGGTPTIAVAVGSEDGVGGVVLRTTDGGQSWTPIGVGTVPRLLTVAFNPYQPENAIAAGAQGALLSTTDAGATWTLVRSSGIDANDTITAVRFGPGVVLATSLDGLIYRSADGGQTWTQVYASPRGSLHGLAFVGASEAVAVGRDGEIVHSPNAGLTWTVVDAPITVSLSGVAATAAELVAVGDGGTILRNTQGGAP